MRKIAFLIICAAISLMSMAQDRVANCFGFSLQGGYATLMQPQNADVLSNHGFGGGAAFIYELQYRGFRFRTGFGADISKSFLKLDIPQYGAAVKEYPTMMYYYDFQNYVERQRYATAYVPVLLGGQFGNFFFMAGAKIGVLPFLGHYDATATMTTWAQDADVIDPLENMYTHTLETNSIQGSGNWLFPQLNVMGTVELGISLDPWLAPQTKYKKGQKKQPRTAKERMHYRLSLFADYGLGQVLSLSNLHAYLPNPVPYATADRAATEGGMMQFGSTSLTDVTPYTSLGYAPYRDHKINNLMVGLKLAIMYEVPTKEKKKKAPENALIVTEVSDKATEEPIPGALVQLVRAKNNKPAGEPKPTDKAGRYKRRIAAGDYYLSAKKQGYYPSESVLIHHKQVDDTVRFSLEVIPVFKAKVIDEKTGRPINATVNILNAKNEVVYTTSLDSVQAALETVLERGQDYHLAVKAEGYYPREMGINSIGDDMTVQMQPLKRFILHNMFFATNKTQILPTSEEALQELYNFLNENPNVRIRIVGHTDDVGSVESNQRLSEGRSKSVRQSMIERGISAGRIETDGKGELEPIVANDSDEHRQMNRRVEIILLTQDDNVRIKDMQLQHHE